MTADSNSSHDNAGSVSRRDFLRVGGLSVVGLSLAERRATAAAGKTDRRSCIFLLMTGGPSQFETFDPKPDAPSYIRGPLKAISTAVPGTAFSESLPKLAERADRLSIVRSLHHASAPLHETGFQLLHTGGLSRQGVRPPSFGSLVAQQLGPRNGMPAYVVLPELLHDTGVEMDRGQTAGMLGAEFDPATSNAAEELLARLPAEPDSARRRYGDSRPGRLCLQARRLVEAGVRCVVVNLFDRLSGELTWDCHGKTGPTPGTPFDYRDVLGPQFDAAASALLDDLHDRGLLDDTLVVATGEFGRTPRINAAGGRDHWPGVWSAMTAGGGTAPGGVIGASDPHGASPADRPVTPGELRATILHSLSPGMNFTEAAGDATESIASSR